MSAGDRPTSAAWRPAQVAAALVIASLALHLGLGGAIELSPQEAYYWQYARHPALSYFDHPPLSAWTIRATTALLGDGVRGIRFAATLHAALFSFFFFLAGRRLFGPGVALWALVTALVTPLFAVGQVVITPDGPLLSGWAAALYFTARALDEERAPWLLAAGAATGLAALGKYTGWLLAPQILAALLLDRRGRRMLLGPFPWLALALAVAIFSPVLVWNSRHGWISFAFQVGLRGSTAGAASLRRFASFVGLQAAAVSPLVLAGVWAAALAAARRWRDPPLRLCAIFSLPALVAFTAFSPFTWVKGNWPAPGYPAALLAATALALRSPRARRFGIAAVLVAAASTAYLHAATVLPALPFPAREDTTRGWRELAARVEEERRRIGGPSFVLGCFYRTASELAYYLPDRPETYSSNAMDEEGLAYDHWFDPAGIVGREGVVVLDRRDVKWCLKRAEFCRPLAPLPPLTVHRGERVVTTFELWRCRYRSPLFPER